MSFIESTSELLEHCNELTAKEVEHALLESHDARIQSWIEFGGQLAKARKALERVRAQYAAGGAL